MKIDPSLQYTVNSQMGAVQDAKNRAAQKASESGGAPEGVQAGPGEGDTVQLSGTLGQVQQLQAQLAQVPEVRSDRIAALRDQIQQGTYRPTNEQLASAMMSDGFPGAGSH